jgi:hypothetical protein
VLGALDGGIQLTRRGSKLTKTIGAESRLSKYLGIIKNQIQNPVPPALRAAQGLGFYI